MHWFLGSSNQRYRFYNHTCTLIISSTHKNHYGKEEHYAPTCKENSKKCKHAADFIQGTRLNFNLNCSYEKLLKTKSIEIKITYQVHLDWNSPRILQVTVDRIPNHQPLGHFPTKTRKQWALLKNSLLLMETSESNSTYKNQYEDHVILSW